MRAWRTYPGAGLLPPRSLCLTTAALAAALVLAGCGGAATGPSAHGPRHCGESHTAANVPVDITVSSGQVACSTALSVERGYAAAIRQGKAPGNGGGGPVSVDGWTCTGFTTPEVLKTGNTSKCVMHGLEILATLPAG